MKTNAKPYARHGDVYIWKVEGDVSANTQKQDKAILAFGEVSGHMHTLRGDLMVDEKYGEEDNIYFEVGEEGATLGHQEHETITLEPGKYVSIVQSEYDPITRFRKVRD